MPLPPLRHGPEERVTRTVASFTYDAADRTQGIVHSAGVTTLSSLTYTRDKVGLVTAENTKGFGYDNRNRLTSQSAGPAITYAYNNGDLPTRIAVSGADTYDFIYNSAQQIKSYSVGPSNQMESHDVIYDPNGNRREVRHLDDSTGEMVVTKIAVYGWDQANRLVANDYGATKYAYDGDGLRTNKTGTGATSFTWNVAEGLPLVLQDGSTSFITGPNGAPIEQINGSGQASFFHQDQLGSTRLLTDAAGAVVGNYTYDPYGNTTSASGTATTPLQYAGEYRDAESGLYYLRARYYHPETAQFLSRDPIEPITRKPYNYAASSPLNFIDPSGLAECKATGQAGKPSGNPEVQTEPEHPAVGAPNTADVDDDVLTPRPRFRTGTVDDAWANATPGANGGRLCPSCGDEVMVPPRSGPRDWDIDHQPPWSQRTGPLSENPNLTRADVIDEFQRGTRLECPVCNRGRGARPL